MTPRPAILLLAIEILASSSALASYGAENFYVARQRRTRHGVSVDILFGRASYHRWPVDLYLVQSTSQEPEFLRRVRGRAGSLVRVSLPYRRLGIRLGSRGFLLGSWSDGKRERHSWGGYEGSASGKPSGTIDFPALLGKAGRRSR